MKCLIFKWNIEIFGGRKILAGLREFRIFFSTYFAQKIISSKLPEFKIKALQKHN